MKASLSKDKDAKVDKGGGGGKQAGGGGGGGGGLEESMDELGWRPWYQLWPKEGGKGSFVPSYNPQGKYAVKLFWMVSVLTL